MQQGSDAARTHRPAGRCVRQPQAPRPQDSSTAVHFRENAVHFHEHAQSSILRTGMQFWSSMKPAFSNRAKRHAGLPGNIRARPGRLRTARSASLPRMFHATVMLLSTGNVHLPKSWTGDPVRMAAAYVPAGIGFATKPALALAMIERARAACRSPGLPPIASMASGRGKERPSQPEAENATVMLGCELAKASSTGSWQILRLMSTTMPTD